MVRPTSYDSNGMRKGAWSDDEDAMLRAHIQRFGHRNWRLVPILAGLKRCGKSCRLRWVNYLKPGVRRGNFTQAEEDLIIQLHAQIGNKWSAIAATLNGRTDNEIKNHWHAHLKKRGSSRRDVSADAATKPSSSIARASNEYQPKKLENPESVFNWQPQAGHLSWADAANYQTSITNVLEALPFVSRELDDMELVCQELDRLNSESNCSNYSSSNHTRSSAESLSPGCLRSNPFGDDAGSYDVMTGLW